MAPVTRICTVLSMKRAFTLLETTVVFVLIGALLAVGVVAMNRNEASVSGERFKTELRQYASSLAHFQSGRGYFPTDLATLATLEPGVTFLPDGIATQERQYAITTGTLSGVSVLGIATIDDSGRCYTLMTPAMDEDSVQEATAVFQSSQATPCSGTTALIQSGDNW